MVDKLRNAIDIARESTLTFPAWGVFVVFITVFLSFMAMNSGNANQKTADLNELQKRVSQTEQKTAQLESDIKYTRETVKRIDENTAQMNKDLNAFILDFYKRIK
jgi:septal ring factor EnvC (AmiA/AmiB activator)